MKRLLLLFVAAVAVLPPVQAYATMIELGRVELTGGFTLNHTYNFNNPPAAPFGTFGVLTVASATGLFGSYVSTGDSLAMNVPFMHGPVAPIDNRPSQQMLWSLGGFTLNTTSVGIAGPDSGRYCFGLTNLSGNGFEPSAHGLGAVSYWHFIAPAYDIGHFAVDITGPIGMTIEVNYDDGHVPDSGSAVALLGISLVGLRAWRKRLG